VSVKRYDRYEIASLHPVFPAQRMYVLASDYDALEDQRRQLEETAAAQAIRNAELEAAVTEARGLVVRMGKLEALLDEMMLGGERDKNWRSTLETIAEPPLEYVRCPNWPCVLPHRHIGPCTTSKTERVK
jgi:hypothetical protein